MVETMTGCAGNELGLRTWSTERQSSEGSDLAEYLRVAIDMANVVSKTSNAQVTGN